MSYKTFFSLDLDLDDKVVPHVCTTSGTDMGALGYTTLDFQINGHPFIQQFIVCQRQTRTLIQVKIFVYATTQAVIGLNLHSKSLKQEVS